MMLTPHTYLSLFPDRWSRGTKTLGTRVLRVALRQLFDNVNGKYQKSKEIATDSNYLRCHALLTVPHFPLETTCSCKQDTKVRYWGQQF